MANSNPTMEELLASQTKKLITLSRGQQVEGEIISISDKEIVLDLGAKSEGILQKRELSESQTKDLKVGSKLKVFITLPENEYGQAILSLSYQPRPQSNFLGKGRGSKSRSGDFKRKFSFDEARFIQAQNQKTKLKGVVLEINKGGLIVEVEGTRGFLPNSQVGFELISKSGQGLDKLISQTLSLTVIEVDSNNNKLIFSQRGQVSDEVKTKLKEFKINQKVTGKIVAVLPFGLVVDISGVEGLVFISDVSWEKIEDLSKDFSTNQEIEVLVIGIDENFGRLNLSLKQLIEDPFSKLSEKYPADEVVKVEVVSVSDAGVIFKLEEGVEGLLPASKMGSTTYEQGKKVTVLVDSVDARKRLINLAPFITSTEGLIYK